MFPCVYRATPTDTLPPATEAPSLLGLVWTGLGGTEVALFNVHEQVLFGPPYIHGANLIYQTIYGLKRA